MRILAACAISAGVLLSAASTIAANADAPPAAKSPQRQCFWTDSINGFNAVDSRTVNVRVGVKDVYRFELLGACPDVVRAEDLAIQSRGSSMICSGLDATIIAPSVIGPQHCAVSAIHKLTPEEIASLPAKQRP